MTAPLRRLPLGGAAWTVRPTPGSPVPDEVAAAFAGGALGATVPGCVHDDLLAHGAIPDPYLADNEARLGWVGRSGWRYARPVPAPLPAAERVDLVAEGLDTVARVELGGALVGTTANMHRTYRWDVTDLLRPGAELAVTFSSPYEEAERLAALVGPMPGPYDEPYPYLRKMASNFGWDWGPTVVTAGIWKDVRLEAWSVARLASVRPVVSLDAPDAATGHVRVVVRVERSASGRGATLDVSATAAGSSGVGRLLPGQDAVELVVPVADVERWWPHGLGAQRLYPLRVELSSDGAVLDGWEHRIGFRHVVLDTSEDEGGDGRAFTLRVGGTPVFAQGFNWIPADVLVSRVEPSDYRVRLVDARDAGANLVRVWGGGIYEKDAFYDACDELGLMVWQDFLFACAAYPETDEYAEQVEAEARDNVERLMPHPSLVLWNGNNENIWGFEEWGWPQVLGDRPWGARYYLDLLPRVVGEVDPSRPYWPGSPYSDAMHPANAVDRGCFHSWDVWNVEDYVHYADSRPRFVAEFGWIGAPAFTTMADALGRPPTGPDDALMLHHLKAENGPAKLATALGRHVEPQEDVDRWHYVTQVIQARAVAYGIDHWRASWPRTAGAVVWQLNDCWPVISWSAVDSAGVRKPLWYAVRDAFAVHRASLRLLEGGAVLQVSSTSGDPWEARPRVRRVRLADGAVLAERSLVVSLGPREARVLELPAEVARPDEPTRELLVVDGAGPRHAVAFAADRWVEWPVPELETELAPDGRAVTVTAGSVLRDLLLQADRLGRRTDTGLVTLLPGERATIRFVGDGAPVQPDDLRFPVVISMGDVGVGRLTT